MLLAIHIQAPSPDPAGDDLDAPGRRSGVGTETLWDHLSRDEQQKMRNRGAGLRQAVAASPPSHPGRRATDRE